MNALHEQRDLERADARAALEQARTDPRKCGRCGRSWLAIGGERTKRYGCAGCDTLICSCAPK